MKRFPWDILLALVVGIGLGLVYAWMIHPQGVTDSDPGTLRADFKEQYRSAIAAAYAASDNLPRAQERLKLLKDPDPVNALNAQAQQMLAQGKSAKEADQIAALAQALKGGQEKTVPVANAPSQVAEIVEETSAPVTAPPSSESPSVITDTPPAASTEETQLTPAPVTPRPTSTQVPTQAVPFKLIGQDEVCDTTLPNGLLQILVLSANRKQMAGIEIEVTWENGGEKFFTGLKPEIGNGYADFIMSPDVAYSVQLASGSDIAAGLTAPTCQDPGGQGYSGGIKLTFQRP